MSRSLFLNLLVRLVLAVGVVTALDWSIHRVDPAFSIFGDVLLLLAWAALVSLWTAQSLRRILRPLQEAAALLVEGRQGPLATRYRDFDGLALSLAAASGQVQRALERAVESRRELESLLDSMQDAVVGVDSAGRIQWTNRNLQGMIPSASVSGAVKIGHALVQTIRDPEVLACVRTAIEERVVNERKSTSLVPGRIFEINASPTPGGGAVAVMHDITRIEEVERTQRDFVANVSHELRTPLTSITGYVETLLDHEASLSPVARDFLRTILKNATRMNRLTEDLLVMARVEGPKQELNPAPVSAAQLVRDAVASMSGLVQENGAVLEIGPTTKCQVFADADSVMQVLGNLIENALKYGHGKGEGRTRSEEDRARVVVSAREVSEPFDAVEFSVRDFGPGIASEHLTRIFERFYRVDKTRSRESGGTGWAGHRAAHGPRARRQHPGRE
ncbi:histidine kinase dimerization/phospho-acceptor domain-containing protein [Granulicella sp. WH15]|uniref:sensor histidine kinase n=1 Tax=Granulicella sp. WH15 TaxID=2602070 RepID=UPI0021050060|nr:histidine kinase dimerization/phospho-acceptor domain-containing protein [Granulicella sp. WH15]